MLRDPSPDGYAIMREVSYGDTFVFEKIPDMLRVAEAFLDMLDD